jgi:hypothetical protein
MLRLARPELPVVPVVRKAGWVMPPVVLQVVPPAQWVLRSAAAQMV